MEDGKEAFSVIEFLGPDDPNEGLGFRLCPSGNQTPQFEHTLAAIEHLCKAMSSAFLTEREAKQALERRLVPKLSLSTPSDSFQPKRLCNKINTIVRRTFLPPMRMNRHLPRVVAHGPLAFGGM